MLIPSGVTRGTLVAVAAVLLALLAVACGQGGSEERSSDGIVVAVASTTPTQAPPPATRTATPTPSPSITPLEVCAPNPDPAPPKLLQVLEPQPDQKVGVPLTVRGWGSDIGLANSGVAVAVLDANQQIVQVLNNVPPQPREYRVPPPGLEITPHTRPFEADVVLAGVSGPTPFCVWVYLATTAEGTPKSVVQVPVLVSP
jgi:hypothetical protein